MAFFKNDTEQRRRCCLDTRDPNAESKWLEPGETIEIDNLSWVFKFRKLKAFTEVQGPGKPKAKAPDVEPENGSETRPAKKKRGRPRKVRPNDAG